MRVTFGSIIKTRYPSENTFKTPLLNKYSHIKEIENVLNGKPSDEYDKKETWRITNLAKRAYPDYKLPEDGADNENAGMYKFIAKDGVYYCCGEDIILAKEKLKEAKEKGLDKKEEMQKFIEDRRYETPMGFLMLENSWGERYNIIGMNSHYENKEMAEKNEKIDCQILYL